MLEKKVKITDHFFKRYKQRAKNHHPRKNTNKNITAKVNNLVKKVEGVENLIFYKGDYFLETKLSRNGNGFFYLLLREHKEYFALVTILTEDMFRKNYGSKINY